MPFRTRAFTGIRVKRLEVLRQLPRTIPWSVVLIALALLAIGWIAIARSEELREEAMATPGRYLRQQAVFSVLAAAVMLTVPLWHYRVWMRWSYALFGLSLALLVIVLFFPAVNGAHRWIRVGGVGVQPSEFAKVAFVLAMARYLMDRENYRRLGGLLAPLGIAMLPVLLIFKEPDLGMSLVFLPVLMLMLFTAGARRSDLAKVFFVGLLAIPLLWTQMSHDQRSRVTSLWNQPSARERPTDRQRHLYQGKRMMALGGSWGSLLTEPATDDLAAYHLPEARNDFVFCVVGERLGLWGQAIVLALYGLLVWRGTAIAARTRDPFGRLVAAGIVAMFAIEAAINTGMTVGLLPITGLSLPLVSYGGSGLLAHGAALGLLLAIGGHIGDDIADEPFRF